MKKILFFFLSLALLSACKQKIDEFNADKGSADFTKYVAIGNSLTAGYADGALYKSGQQNSYPNILAQQFTTVGGGAFIQPLIETEDGIGLNLTPIGLYLTPKMVLKILPDRDCGGIPIPGSYSLKPDLLTHTPDQAAYGAILAARPVVAGPYNNMGVPGAALQHLFFKGYGSALGNPFFTRFASNPMASILEDALAQQPTFFSLWIGNYDVLTSALAGTASLVTPVDTFAKYYPLAVGALVNSTKKPKGIVATIPDITSIPFFTTISTKVPYNSVFLDSTEAAGLNTLYTMYGHGDIKWKAGANPFVVAREDGKWVQMGASDLFLLTLPTDSLKCRGMGIADTTVHPIPKPYPIPGKFVLDATEQTMIQQHVNAYNGIIKQTAGTLGVAVADMNQEVKSFASGMIFDGIKFNTSFISGGLFSTDGIHMNPRGNALTTNIFIRAINSKYGSSIPEVSVTDFHGLTFP
jgi:lysophospholipase L1-like esterase